MHTHLPGWPDEATCLVPLATYLPLGAASLKGSTHSAASLKGSTHCAASLKGSTHCAASLKGSTHSAASLKGRTHSEGATVTAIPHNVQDDYQSYLLRYPVPLRHSASANDDRCSSNSGNAIIVLLWCQCHFCSEPCA